MVFIFKVFNDLPSDMSQDKASRFEIVIFQVPNETLVSFMSTKAQNFLSQDIQYQTDSTHNSYLKKPIFPFGILKCCHSGFPSHPGPKSFNQKRPCTNSLNTFFAIFANSGAFPRQAGRGEDLWRIMYLYFTARQDLLIMKLIILFKFSFIHFLKHVMGGRGINYIISALLQSYWERRRKKHVF